MGEDVSARDHVLVGFTALVGDLFDGQRGRTAAERLKVLLGPTAPRARDPFQVLRFAASCGRTAANVVERQLCRLESEALLAAEDLPGSQEALRHLASKGCTLTVITNHGIDCVRSYLTMRDLTGQVRRISARVTADPERLLPGPHLVQQAIRALATTAEHCVLIAGSAAESAAARAAGVACVRGMEAICG
ncbi:hypothetical protein GCM10010174_65820 [Kutzneria viridogrisea]|uniref:HAD family hydrolase n=2 Tax=Kutzneria TaxID=43356 RepID=W5W8W2_9PSEU|nr:HAD hydrolase-like protein [Kutzneria albida]AHH97155.1 hypothetical protein KALB_3791 [Kutzneria albida DSM 43870]MBA8931874.1 beta-phosphoglucomutase-like phosphatase (HAD superfamily) [Kutzneria viridogrisea]